MERIKAETKKEIEEEVQRRVVDALLKMGLTEEQIDSIRKKRQTGVNTEAENMGKS